ncbi:MAG: nucleotide exchange factor GrpE [Gemmatimonadota bacterium]
MMDEQRLNDGQAVASDSADTDTNGVATGDAAAAGGIATEPAGAEAAATVESAATAGPSAGAESTVSAEGGGASTPADGGAEAELAALRAELETLNDRYLRLAAEFDNYRKRIERERGEAWTRAQAELAARLLESLDDLQRVAAYEADGASIDSVLEGIRLVEKKLRGALEASGLIAIDVAEGQPFDPATMEALMTVPAETSDEDDVIADVFQKGYRFKEILLRPARVRVRKFEPET